MLVILSYKLLMNTPNSLPPKKCTIFYFFRSAPILFDRWLGKRRSKLDSRRNFSYKLVFLCSFFPKFSFWNVDPFELETLMVECIIPDKEALFATNCGAKICRQIRGSFFKGAYIFQEKNVEKIASRWEQRLVGAPKRVPHRRTRGCTRYSNGGIPAFLRVGDVIFHGDLLF